jgi:hypothetical protein
MKGRFTKEDALWRGSEEREAREVRKLKEAEGPDLN